MENVKLVRNLKTSCKGENTWLWLESTVLESAGFSIGDGVQLSFVLEAIVLRKSEDAEHVISKRKRPSWSHARPLFDRCNKEITKVIRARERIDVLVSEGQIVIRRERSFDLL